MKRDDRSDASEGTRPGRRRTLTPEEMTSREILQSTRALNDVDDLVGFDLVEVSPPYDDDAGSTAILAANVAFEALCALVE